MKKKLFLLVFSIVSLLGITAFRTYILGNCIDDFNGFFYPEYYILRYIFAAVLAVILIVVAAVAVSDKEFPGSPRRSSKVLAFGNGLYGILILCDSFTYLSNLKTAWDKVNFILLILLACFMIYYAICLFTFTNVSLIFSTVPLLYFIYKLFHMFITSFGIIKSSEVTLKIVALIFCVLFFDFYFRYISNANFKKVRKTTLITGVCACITCAVASIPDLITPLIYSDIDARTASNENFLFLITAVYIAVFLLSSYSKKQLYHAYSNADSDYNGYK